MANSVTADRLWGPVGEIALPKIVVAVAVAPCSEAAAVKVARVVVARVVVAKVEAKVEVVEARTDFVHSIHTRALFCARVMRSPCRYSQAVPRFR